MGFVSIAKVTVNSVQMDFLMFVQFAYLFPMALRLLITEHVSPVHKSASIVIPRIRNIAWSARTSFT